MHDIVYMCKMVVHDIVFMCMLPCAVWVVYLWLCTCMLYYWFIYVCVRIYYACCCMCPVYLYHVLRANNIHESNPTTQKPPTPMVGSNPALTSFQSFIWRKSCPSMESCYTTAHKDLYRGSFGSCSWFPNVNWFLFNILENEYRYLTPSQQPNDMGTPECGPLVYFL